MQPFGIGAYLLVQNYKHRLCCRLSPALGCVIYPYRICNSCNDILRTFQSEDPEAQKLNHNAIYDDHKLNFPGCPTETTSFIYLLTDGWYKTARAISEATKKYIQRGEE